MESVSNDAADAVVVGIDGREYRLKDTWAERPVVLAFVRHFG